jgi:hypothetical protein
MFCLLFNGLQAQKVKETLSLWMYHGIALMGAREEAWAQTYLDPDFFNGKLNLSSL